MSDAHSGSSSRDSQHGPVSVAPLKVRRAGRFAAGQVIASSTRLLDDTGGVASRSGTPDLEQTLRSHKLVSEIAIIKPKAGLLEGKRLAFLTFSDYEAEQSVFPGGVNLIPSRHLFLAGTQVSSLRRTLKNSHDANNESLPDLCVVLSDMPRNASGNIDRRALRTWAQNLNEQTYETVRRLEHGKESRTQTTDMEKTLQRLVAQVLRVPRRWIGMDMTFCQAGGDETAAAELSALCMHESINLDASDLLDDVTLEALVTLATERGGPAHNWNSDVGTPFDLAPMQLLYFLSPMGRGHRRKVRRDARYRFNQSFLLRLKDRRSIDDVSAAVETVVAHHAMLRSRFAFVSGKWTQRILPAVPGSFYFARHTVSSVADLEMIMASSQATIDLENGPVFSVDCISLSDEQQMLYLVAHQLAVDLSSWRLVVHDLGQLLETGNLSSRRSMPFRKWIELQKSAVQDLITNDDQVLVPGKSPPSFAYWGLTKVSDTYGEALETSFLLSPDLTEALEGPCNAAYRTESTDIYIACLLLAFAQTFHDRAVPVVWNQELGRSSRNGDVDISQTVGCFTSLSPVAERIDLHDDLFRVLRKVKDGRRRAARLVSRSFDSLFCEPHSWGSSCFDRSFEILFSYSGSLLDPNREGGVLELVHLPDTLLSPSTPDYGSAVGRVAVFEISVVFCDGAAKVRFLYCPNASRQDRISLWISNYEHLLLDAIGRLRYREQQLTLSDVPHLDLTYDGLEKLTNDRLPALGVASLQDVETVYPVTAPQQAILICQMREPGSCVLRIVSEIHSADGEMIDTSRIRLAWGMVTRQHAALRTIFIESVTETGLYDQVVLRNPPPVIQFVDVAPLDDPVDVLNGLPSLEGATNQPPYRLAICTGLGKTLMRFDVSMAACDGASVDIIIDDLRRIYRSQATISSSLKFVYEDYLAFLETARSSQTLAFWQDRLRGVKSCMFPYLTSLPHHRQRSYSSVALETPREDLVVFSRSCGVSVGAVVQLAWALVLRLFSGTDTPCFGYLTEGRTDSVPGLLRAVGSFANVVPFHLVLSEEKSLLECIQETERRIRSALPHQYVSVPELQHALGVKGPRGLLNSCVSFSDLQIGQNLSLPSPASVWIKPVSQSRSSFEVDLVIRFSDTGLTADLCQSVMTEGQAAGLVATFDQALQAIMSSVERSVNGVNILSDRDYAQMLSWNTGGSDTIGSRVLGMTVPDLVVTRAENHPNAPAICAWDGAFVYQELIDTATTLAHHLIDDGAGPRTIIPVVMEKSLWAPVAMLAVLK
ncbi:hypothetical protein VTK73DRAFT_5631 [Phialemonium thermophilum]|uniref:Condensation domain-containing protein n=1 Tax=Phialemonium thermophilum TaxID=223376 RepID=A0ABR3WMG2_9PEZI